MRIYLAARYSRREELCGYRDELKSMGHAITSRWLNGKHQIDNAGVPIGDDGEQLIEDGAAESAALREEFAIEDIRDVRDARCLISFTEAPRSGHSRGGRHVEFGLAIENLQRLIVVGHRENLFHWLPTVEFYETWDAAKAAL